MLEGPVHTKSMIWKLHEPPTLCNRVSVVAEALKQVRPGGAEWMWQNEHICCSLKVLIIVRYDFASISVNNSLHPPTRLKPVRPFFQKGRWFVV